mmetsp:Transcript_13123/g.23499  ORF Transcript_13123/g.23499 Transcript_13123/m.23499 type:complete len:100 (+) Transcript_13123:756-1055(+)
MDLLRQNRLLSGSWGLETCGHLHMDDKLCHRSVSALAQVPKIGLRLIDLMSSNLLRNFSLRGAMKLPFSFLWWKCDISEVLIKNRGNCHHHLRDAGSSH